MNGARVVAMRRYRFLRESGGASRSTARRNVLWFIDHHLAAAGVR